jgi:hypothetical protein
MNILTFLAQTPTLTPVATPTATATATAMAATAATTLTATPTPTATPYHVFLEHEPFWGSSLGIFIIIIIILAAGVLVGLALHKGGSSAFMEKLFANFTDMLAYWVVILAFIGIFVLGYVVLSWDHTADTTKYVFAAVLPLLGTWVGTVLAHYFQKENLAAATQSISDLAKTVGSAGKLATLPVKNFMIGPGKITTLPPDLQGKLDADIPLKKISEHLTSVKLDRLPLFAGNKDTGVVEKVVHLSKIEKYLADKVIGASASSGTPPGPAAAGAPAVAAEPAAPAAPAQPAAPMAPAVSAAPPAPAAESIAALTLANLFKDQPVSVFKNFTFIKESATLADAKVAMDGMTNTPGVEGNCYDVFVTATGACSEPVIGWITNDIINDNAKV